MIIGIATKNPVKIRAVQTAMERLKATFSFTDSPVRYSTHAVASGVSDMPLSMDEMIRGARQRAQRLFEQGGFHWTLGLEGGVFNLAAWQQPETLMLQNWVCLYDGVSYSYGCSAALPLPASFHKPLLEGGEELAAVIDRFAGKEDVRSNEGAFGVLSHGLYDRRQAFTQAVLNAMIPVVNIQYKGD